MQGGRWGLAAAAVALAGCASQPESFGMRAIADPLAKAAQPGSSMLAEARAMLGLGNVGLAIEAYRKELRQHPASVEAYAGLAECYERMGRYDLSRTNYESALAIAPENAILLRTFAVSLDRQGRRAEAQAVRAEAANADAADARALAETAVEPTTPEVKVAEERVAAPVLDPTQPAVGSITVRLPEARPATTVKEPQALAKAAAPASAPAPEPRVGPRLERLSLAEVVLVTTNQPRWKPEIVRRTASSTTVRFVPLADLRRSSMVRLLNAARQEGLAARTRLALNRKGWPSVTIGDAGKVREKSLILYSASTADAARRLAGELKLGIARDPRPGPLTILLGRDAVTKPAKA